MATPPLHTPDPNNSGCDKISSKCVIWQGPDIPCIDLCKGDTVDIVISKIATTICEVADLTSLDVSCLLGPGDAAPTTVTELVELMISNICGSTGNINTLRKDVDLLIVGGPVIDPNNPVLPLPPGLYYYDTNGDVVTQLPLTDYVLYLADKIIELINIADYYKQQQALINSRVDALTIRVATLENITAAPPEILVISQGASHYIPGTVLPIDEGFWNFERTYMGFSGTVGTPEDLTTAISKQTPNLGNLPQLSTPSLFMKNLAGWVNSPLTLAHSFNNLWLTMTDLRARVQADINAIPAVPCVLVPIESQTVTDIATAYAVLAFVPSSLTTIQGAIGYKIEVFDHAVDPTLLTPIHTVTTLLSPVTLTNVAFIPDKEYTIATTALYNCGESTKMTIISKLLVVTIAFQINLEWVEFSESGELMCITDDLEDTPYTIIQKDLIVTLVNKITQLPVVNDTESPIIVKLKFQIENYCGTGAGFQDNEISLPVGMSEVTTTYTSQSMIKCSDGLCHGIMLTPYCGISISNINTEFGTITETPLPTNPFPICTP